MTFDQTKCDRRHQRIAKWCGVAASVVVAVLSLGVVLLGMAVSRTDRAIEQSTEVRSYAREHVAEDKAEKIAIKESLHKIESNQTKLVDRIDRVLNHSDHGGG